MPADPGRDAELTVSGPRPVAAVALELEDRFHRVVTYEDPPYPDPADRAPGPVPRPGTITIGYGRSEPVEQVLRRAIEAHERARNPGWFAVVRAGDRLDVVPRAYRTAAGDVVERIPLLDTVIPPAPERTDGIAFLEGLAAALHRARGEAVEIGTVPVNLLAGHRSAGGEKPIAARHLLGARLSRLGPGLSWQLLNDPGSGAFVLNIHRLSAQR
jgi:hypothetical protein